MYIEPLQVLTYIGGYPEPQNIPLIKQKHPLTSIPTTTISVKVFCNPFLINNCLNTAHLLGSITHFIFAMPSVGFTLLLCKFIFTYSLEVGRNGGLKIQPILQKISLLIG